MPAEPLAGVGAISVSSDTEITDATGIDFDLRQGDFQEGHELPLVTGVLRQFLAVRAKASTSARTALNTDCRLFVTRVHRR